METEKEMTAIQKTQVYLENYREIERYIKDAISEVSQIDDVSRYNISAEGDRMRKELTEKVVQINDRTSLNQIIRCKSNRK